MRDKVASQTPSPTWLSRAQQRKEKKPAEKRKTPSGQRKRVFATNTCPRSKRGDTVRVSRRVCVVARQNKGERANGTLAPCRYNGIVGVVGQKRGRGDGKPVLSEDRSGSAYCQTQAEREGTSRESVKDKPFDVRVNGKRRKGLVG